MFRRVLNSVAGATANISAMATAAATGTTATGLGSFAGASGDRAFSTTFASAGPATAMASAAHHGMRGESTHAAPPRSTVLSRFTGASEDPHDNHLMHPEPTHTFFGAAIRSPKPVHKKKNLYGKKPARAARHGASTVVGKHRLHSCADGFRAPNRPPPFPKAKFTRQLSLYEEHHAQQTGTEDKATHREQVQKAPLSSNAAGMTNAGPNPAPAAARHAHPLPPQCSTVAAAQNPGTAAVPKAPHRQPDMSAVMNTAKTSSKGTTTIPRPPASTVVKVSPLSPTPQKLFDRVKDAVLVPFSAFTVSMWDRVSIYFCMAVALITTYILFELLYPELVFYGILPPRRVRQMVKTVKAAKAESGPSKATTTTIAMPATSAPSPITTPPAAAKPQSSRIIRPGHCVGIASVLVASTVPWHLAYFGMASLLGKKACAKKFLADWGRAVLPAKVAKWYTNLIRAPKPVAG